MSFSNRNRIRCEHPSGFNHPLSSWTLSDWTTATLGELGEAANIVKKLNRYRDGIPGNVETEEELRAALADEIADTVIYLDLLAQAAGLDLTTIRDAKFAKTSKKIGYVEPHFGVHGGASTLPAAMAEGERVVGGGA
jgi:NTP pyrophosphatase (non-canonical NTP hydrolase)